jgi:hypothetical protein
VKVTVPLPIQEFTVVTTGNGFIVMDTLPLTLAGHEGVVGY